MPNDTEHETMHVDINGNRIPITLSQDFVNIVEDTDGDYTTTNIIDPDRFLQAFVGYAPPATTINDIHPPSSIEINIDELVEKRARELLEEEGYVLGRVPDEIKLDELPY